MPPAAARSKFALGGDWTMAAVLVGVLAVAIAPLPPTLFDLLIGAALCLPDQALRGRNDCAPS